MATPAELLDNMVPVSAFSRGKAAQAFSSASSSTPVIVLKNNVPYRIITTPDEYAYLSEVEADMVLMAEAIARLTGNQGGDSLSAEQVYAELGVAPEDVADADDVELA
ncbi:antitoxin PHD [Gordonibacter massiliensis (ex Traore et al. 2017)]|uniref:antitoxin PHD n=1 Tax=Gordonibacter massiliensis (ex Traore et al. 2017) TaxID=1841863 RepID=UPI001C8CE747|nr:antitoxin PHD [Gordonibacter massiliensis (ex Traore et al. 2017)]MBX9033183.1 antitoxin PHD [Gordonibacter massiliensis (ex Traore et al. 2017)]